MHRFAISKHPDKTSRQKSLVPGTNVSSYAGNQRRQIREALSYNPGEDSTEVLQKQEAAQRQPEEEEELLQSKSADARGSQLPSGEVVQRQPMEEEEELMQPKLSDGSQVQQYQEEDSGANGTAMPASLQAGLEALSDMDLSGTRVHTNSVKPARVNALAYTQGQDIYVAPGQEQHLPHEGWHVVQQLQGRVKPSREVNGQSINDDVALEREADVMGEKAAKMSLPAAKVLPQQDGAVPVAQHKCEECAREDDLSGMSIQTKSAAHISTGDPRFKIDGFTSTRGISLPTSIQRQSSDDDIGEQDPQKKAEYDSLRPQEGGGSSSGAATIAGGGAIENEAVQLKANDVMQRVTCTPANTGVGNNALSFAERSRESWRSHVTYRANVDNRNDHLRVRMYVFAKVYYGLWVSWEHIRFNATVDLTCQASGDSCEISANERGGSVWDLSHSPAAGAIAVQTDRRAGNSQMALTVRVGGSVGASSSVSAGVGSASAGVSFPDASISHKMSMGTFIYTCQSS
ncbi:DUF4157 domain-containing protein [Thalassomonas viridans]|uniref:DUF4157 domain-containing protein n=1 Tax=Thalassomonas viridans TaxID=137584 RepID=A0AAE9Z039_9GAMM|nr:DUF4157 domain-containing protein [Thalassomonas viridans]WDE03635.1 DUF4157 domain-containing protein [Thalassomonas viridans]